MTSVCQQHLIVTTVGMHTERNVTVIGVAAERWREAPLYLDVP